MRHSQLTLEMRPPEESIARFGGAEVTKTPDGAMSIRGGTDYEKAEAHRWLKRFLTQAPFTIKRLR